MCFMIIKHNIKGPLSLGVDLSAQRLDEGTELVGVSGGSEANVCLLLQAPPERADESLALVAISGLDDLDALVRTLPDLGLVLRLHPEVGGGLVNEDEGAACELVAGELKCHLLQLADAFGARAIVKSVLLGDLGENRLNAVAEVDAPQVVKKQCVLAFKPQLVVGELGTPLQAQVAPLLHEGARGDVGFNLGSVDLARSPRLVLYDLPAVRHVSFKDLAHDTGLHAKEAAQSAVAEALIDHGHDENALAVGVATVRPQPLLLFLWCPKLHSFCAPANTVFGRLNVWKLIPVRCPLVRLGVFVNWKR